MDALRPEFAERIAFVIADLSTREGQAFASRFGVGETTLVFFDRNGMTLDQYHGTVTEAHLRRIIEGNFADVGARQDFSSQPPMLDAIRNKYNQTAKDIIDSIGR